MSKLFAILVYLIYVVLIFMGSEHIFEKFKYSVIIFLPVLLILFPEQFGNYLGPSGRGTHINTKTPGLLVSFGGWLILLGVPAIIFLLAPKTLN
jgi:hypothetical protein